MKKLLIITILAFVLSGCASNNAFTKNKNYIDEANIKEVNSNSYMGIELNQDSGLSEEESKRYSMDYPYVMYSGEGDAEYYCFRYPNNEFPLTVTQIEINDSKYNVFGISIGDDMASAVEILQEKGYKEEDFPVKNSSLYSKGDVQIILDYNETTIEEIVVSLKIETAEGVKY